MRKGNNKYIFIFGLAFAPIGTKMLIPIEKNSASSIESTPYGNLSTVSLRLGLKLIYYWTPVTGTYTSDELLELLSGGAKGISTSRHIIL